MSEHNEHDEGTTPNLVKLEKGDTLLHEGENSHSMYWLQKGQLSVHKKHGNSEILLGHVYSGEIVGEMSFLDDEPRSATVRALTDCELLEIHNEKYEKIFLTQPKWLQVLIRTLLDRLRRANARIKV